MMIWIHEISQTALAASVATLGLVILLELRSIARLRRAVDGHLARLFEQLDLMRFESQQLQEKQVSTLPAFLPSPAPSIASSPVPAPVKAPVKDSASTPAASSAVATYHAAQAPALVGGEARLLAALTAARARLAAASGSSVVHQETA
jgi:hypothetical protein